MDPKIITRFTVASVPGINALLYLTQTITREKFQPLLSKEQIEKYISETFNSKKLLDDINSLSDQWLVVYSNDNPAGFARITSAGKRPKALSDRRAIRIADFGLVKEYTLPAIKQSLFDKCMSICRSYEAVWIEEYQENPFIRFFESEGFVRHSVTSKVRGLPLHSYYLIKQPC